MPHPVLLETHRAVQAKYGVTVRRVLAASGTETVTTARRSTAIRDMRYTEDTLVVILTLGARRPWLLRRRDRRDKWIAPNGGAAFDLSPAGGDLFVLGGRAQADWEHSVAEGPGRRGPRGPHLRTMALDLAHRSARARRLLPAPRNFSRR